ncbi:hypothetical protein [Pseudomonas koreensis]|uniref:hypothetical protein n=1 Tax=Pseudomonas koreensis TaxID=198620 RepID=UPI0014751A9C|nr:hypothetical protein [Pseudomonas koreensis]NNA59019.1 hypothetical protein [Pseudomonas koreensis]
MTFYTWTGASIWHPFDCKCSSDPKRMGSGCNGNGMWYSGPLNPTEYCAQIERDNAVKEVERLKAEKEKQIEEREKLEREEAELNTYKASPKYQEDLANLKKLPDPVGGGLAFLSGRGPKEIRDLADKLEKYDRTRSDFQKKVPKTLLNICQLDQHIKKYEDTYCDPFLNF